MNFGPRVATAFVDHTAQAAGVAPLTPPAALTLATAPVGRSFVVRSVLASDHAPDWPSQLADIGFLPGERVAVMARGMPGNDPLVVRVGLSTFALRAAEAACVQIQPVVAHAEVADPTVMSSTGAADAAQ